VIGINEFLTDNSYCGDKLKPLDRSIYTGAFPSGLIRTRGETIANDDMALMIKFVKAYYSPQLTIKVKESGL
jgi:hypothetical protein